MWQGRFGSVALDEDHPLNAVRYVALNPVRGQLVKNAEDWPWSSARSYLSGEDDGVTQREPMLLRFPDVKGMFDSPQIYNGAAFNRLRKAETIGRPLGRGQFLQSLADKFGRTLAPGKPGPKRRSGEPN